MLQALRELVRYRELVRHLVLLDLRLRYRGNVLGFLWTLLNPLLLMLVLNAVFSRMARVHEDHYALFLLSALMVWTFFSQSVERSLTAIIANAGLFRKIYVPKVVFPISVVTSNLVNLVFFLAAYLGLSAVLRGVPPTAALVPAVLAMVYLLSAGSALLMSALTVFFRDFTHLTSVLLRALFYLTPILYRPGLFESIGDVVLRCNPAYYPVVIARDLLYAGHVPPLELWLTGYGVAALVFLLGLRIFTATEARFVYYA